MFFFSKYIQKNFRQLVEEYTSESIEVYEELEDI